jgi:tetratricopeptide (TPR) repeat protein
MRYAIIIPAIAVALSAPALAQKIDEPSAGQRIISAVAKDLASTHLKNGSALWQNAEYGAALAEFKKAIELDPTNSQAYVSRAAGYEKIGEHDTALVDVNEAMRLDSKNADALSFRGVIYSRKGDQDKALADANAAIALEPNSLHYNNRGFVYNNMNDYDRAIADLNEAIRLNPKSVLAYKNRAVSYEKKNQLKEASDDYDFAVKLNPKLQEAVDGAIRVRQLLAKGSGSQQILDSQPPRIVGADLYIDLARYTGRPVILTDGGVVGANNSFALIQAGAVTFKIITDGIDSESFRFLLKNCSRVQTH